MAVIAAPIGNVIRYEYDRDRRLLATVLPSGQRIENKYVDGQLDRTITPEVTRVKVHP
ncbi:hypothetical protein [Bacterioplanoides sp.]|uniref:hypothetical protein n=1 Tax=Bacterioplanoides sp. TaxID=2066072 RepID=UPI003B000FD6